MFAQCCSQHFCRTGSIPVDKYNNFLIFVLLITADGFVILLRAVLCFLTEDNGIVRKQIAGNFLCGFQIAAGIVPQIQNQVLTAILLQTFQMAFNLFPACFRKGVKLQYSGFPVDTAVYGILHSCFLHLDFLMPVFPYDFQCDFITLELVISALTSLVVIFLHTVPSMA